MIVKHPSQILFVALFWVMCLGKDAEAHPHIFVDARTGFLFTGEGQLRALKIAWTYDEFTTLFLFETLNLDKDGDGVFDDADRAAVIEGETNWDPGYKGDIYLEVSGHDYPLGRPEAAAVILENNKIEVSFELPLPKHLDVKNVATILRLYDPVFYYSYTILPSLDAMDLPAGCKAQIVPFEPEAAEIALREQLAALSSEDTPTMENVGRLFSDEVRLICE